MTWKRGHFARAVAHRGRTPVLCLSKRTTRFAVLAASPFANPWRIRATRCSPACVAKKRREGDLNSRVREDSRFRIYRLGRARLSRLTRSYSRDVFTRFDFSRPCDRVASGWVAGRRPPQPRRTGRGYYSRRSSGSSAGVFHSGSDPLDRQPQRPLLDVRPVGPIEQVDLQQVQGVDVRVPAL